MLINNLNKMMKVILKFNMKLSYLILKNHNTINKKINLPVKLN